MDSRRRCLILTVLPATVLLACVDHPAGPAGTGGFDAARATSAVQMFDSVFSGAPWLSFRALGPAMGAPLITGRPVTSSPAGVPRLPREVRGITMVYDPAAGRYVPDGSRAGAPANGVRFVLYETDVTTGLPVVAREIGHADVTDEGDALADGVALRLRMFVADTPRLDYFVRTAGGASSSMVVAAGVFGDSAAGLRFEVAHTVVDAAADSISLQFGIEFPAHDFAAAGVVRNVNSGVGTVGEASVVVRPGAGLVQLNARGDGASVDAVVSVNGRPFARIAGAPASPEIRGAGGRPLTEDEHSALGGFLRLVEGVLGVAQGLLQPAGMLLGG